MMSTKVSYETKDPNANSNGVLSGTCTKPQIVQGNGETQ
jgi:hypothetical protein